jgi:hypothetical protein
MPFALQHPPNGEPIQLTPSPQVPSILTRSCAATNAELASAQMNALLNVGTIVIGGGLYKRMEELTPVESKSYVEDRRTGVVMSIQQRKPVILIPKTHVSNEPREDASDGSG